MIFNKAMGWGKKNKPIKYVVRGESLTRKEIQYKYGVYGGSFASMIRNEKSMTPDECLDILIQRMESKITVIFNGVKQSTPEVSASTGIKYSYIRSFLDKSEDVTDLVNRYLEKISNPTTKAEVEMLNNYIINKGSTKKKNNFARVVSRLR